jgi:hypothetical protein
MKKRLKNGLVVLVPVVVLVGVTALSLMPPSKIPHAGGWFSHIPYGDKAIHFGFYFCLVTAIRFARTHAGKYDKACPWRLLAMAAAYGGAIELLQGRYFDRGSDLLDEAANILGAAAALWLIPQGWHEKLKLRIER